MARRHLLDFTRYTWPGYLVNWHHQVLAEKLTRVARGELKRLMVFMPPRHGKSEMVSVRFPAFILGQNPDAQILTCSHTSGLAVDLNRNCQSVVMSNRYRNLFPETRLSASGDTDKYDVPPKRTSTMAEVIGRRGVLRSAGVGTAIAGKGFDIGIVDDPFSGHKQADSPVERETVWNWYQRDFLTRRSSDDAAIVLTHTRWHRDDLAGRLLVQAADEREQHKWEVVCFRGIRRDEKNPDDSRMPGDVLWPWRMSEAGMRSAEQDPRGFAALYQQDPTADGGVEWPSDCFEGDIWVDEIPRQDFRFIAVDPSKGKRADRGDFSAIVYVGMGGERVYVDAKVERWNPTRIVQELFSMSDQYEPDMVAFETNQFQELFVNEIHRVAEQIEYRGSYLAKLLRAGVQIFQMENKFAKEFRIRRLSKWITGRDFLFKRSPDCRRLIDQLRDFPMGEHDDGPDALEMAMRLAGIASGGINPDAVAASPMLQVT